MQPMYSRVLSALAADPWAILPDTLETMCAVLEARANGGPSMSKDETRAAMGAPVAAAPSIYGGGGGSVAVIPLAGILSPKMNMLAEFSGGTSLAMFRKQLATAAADAGVKAIVLAVDSPGGSVTGCEETWNAVREAAKMKPVVASVDALMGSGALWIASACDEIDMTPSGTGGSLGVFCVHRDLSKAEAEAGVKVTYITADISPFKNEGNPDEPLGDDARAALKQRVNHWAGIFLSQVAKGRELSESVVQKTFGMGRTLVASEALEVGMIDRVATFDATIARMLTVKPTAGARASVAGAFAKLVAGGADDLDPEEPSEDELCPECKGSGLKTESQRSDPAGQEPCEACEGTGKRTAAATNDDALADEHALLAALSRD